MGYINTNLTNEKRYNFDAISCESCKAFFRRNALRPPDKLKCRGNGNCNITVETRKRCKRCRLDKCFKMGMRKEWILSDEDKRKKKRKAEENRRRKQTQEPTTEPPRRRRRIATSSKTDRSSSGDGSPSHVTIDDPIYIMTDFEWSKIHQIQSAYTEAIAYNQVVGVPPYPATHPIHSTLELIRIPIPSYPNTTKLNFTSEMVNLPTNLQASRLITFLKLIPEFSSLDEHDKLVLIKHNTFPLLFIRSALVYNRATDSYYDQGTDDCVFSGKDLIQCFSLDQYEKSTRCVCRVMDASHNDPFIIQIFLLIMILSKGSSVCTYTEEFEPVANNIQSLFHTQNIFVNLLLKYCESKFGYTQTVHIWLKLVMSSIDAHLQSHTTRYNFVKKDDVAEQLVPLMKSVLLNA
ncbi:unnamed protein product [Adineta steineri]|uniref:Uncharacterized protein n=1 Tax=Adineta steineri TaxID=433720 RepID=A0A815DG71_9BILA|nr:unnamed protein product [Adineta steineri]